MLTPEQSHACEKTSLTNTRICCNCFTDLKAGEVYCCQQCVDEWYIETDPNGAMSDE